MTAPKTCPDCGAALDPEEICECQANDIMESAPPSEGLMEFVMGTDLDKALPASIDFNFEQLRGQLVQALDRYQGLVITADDIKGAKADRAKLNALRAALEDKRKEIKRRCMEPYNAFEVRVKELVRLIDQPVAAIDGQLKTYEEQRREEKYTWAAEYYEKHAEDLAQIVPFDRLWRDEWYNTGFTRTKAMYAIDGLIKQIRDGLSTLETVESDFAEAVKLKYLETLDLSVALAERARLQEQARRLREFEAEQRKREAIAKLQGAESPQDPQKSADHERCAVFLETVQKPQEVQTDKVYRLVFECQVTTDQAAALAEYLRSNNITYRRI